MLYVIINGDGTRQRVATSALAPAEGQSLKVFPDLDAEPDSEAYVWNTTTHEYDEIVMPGSPSYTRTKLTKREFLQRLDTAGALDQIDARLATPPATVQDIAIVAGLRKLDRYITTSEFVDLELPLTVAGVGQLVALGYLTEAAAAVVLAPSTVAAE